MKRRTRAEEFTRRVPPEPEGPDDCQEWGGNIRKADGYGEFCYANTRVLAHRAAYELNVGPISDELQIDHLCRNRACVRPDHLEAVTQQVNIARGEVGLATGAKQRAKTHCPRGHPYAGPNLITVTRKTRNPERRCRTCANDATRRCTAKKKKKGTK